MCACGNVCAHGRDVCAHGRECVCADGKVCARGRECVFAREEMCVRGWESVCARAHVKILACIHTCINRCRRYCVCWRGPSYANVDVEGIMSGGDCVGVGR